MTKGPGDEAALGLNRPLLVFIIKMSALFHKSYPVDLELWIKAEKIKPRLAMQREQDQIWLSLELLSNKSYPVDLELWIKPEEYSLS